LSSKQLILKRNIMLGIGIIFLRKKVLGKATRRLHNKYEKQEGYIWFFGQLDYS
jgi:hypothetical protein